MGAIPIHHTATDDNSSWDGPAEVAKAPNEEKTLHYMHAWVEAGGDPNAKGSYKFPHHDAGTDTAANIAGVDNALARLSQADIPSGDDAGVKAHLQAHKDDAAKKTNSKAEGTPIRHRDASGGINGSYILQAFVGTPWAILPHKLAVLEEIVIRHISGEKLDAEEVQARVHGARRPDNRQVNAVAVLPLFGTIFPRANMMTDVSGATSAERFGAQFAELVQDPNITAIVLDVDSPGGQAAGVEELSQQIYDARGKKPIVAVANHTMASAAYWIGTSADEVVVTPSGDIGSIGVFAVHKDMSAALAQDGIKVTLISKGKHKIDGNQFEPLTEEAKATIEANVSQVYDAFVTAIGRNRGVDPAAVRNGFGEGRTVSAHQAVEMGMADRVGTLDETIDRLINGTVLPASMQAVKREREVQRLRDYVHIHSTYKE